jgi:hypothetical protein
MHDSYHDNFGYLLFFAVWGFVWVIYKTITFAKQREYPFYGLIIYVVWIIIFLLIITNARCPL